MSEVSDTTAKKCGILPECLCVQIGIPHDTEHVQNLPLPPMPVLNLPVIASPVNEKEQRVRELLMDCSKARAQDTELKQKFEKRAEQLLADLKAEVGKSCQTSDLWLPKKEGPIEDAGCRLKLELEQSRFQSAELRNQMHSLKKELALYQKLLRQEVGCDYNLQQVLANDQWKGRAEEIDRLKSEISAMESKAYGHKYKKNPITIPQYNPKFPRIEDLIPRRQVECLKREAARRKEKTEHTDMSILMEEYGNLALMYKANSTHNKILAEELRSLKEQLAVQESKAKEDLELIKNLTTHQLQMREMLDRKAHLNRLVKKKEIGDIPPEKEEEIDTDKYKTLWEVSEYQKQSLLEMVGLLTDRLDDVMKKTEEAEKHCLENQSRQKELEEQIKEQNATAAAQKKTSKAVKSKQAKSTGSEVDDKTFSIDEQLSIVQDENDFLKSFLHRTIETKENDLNLYRLTLSTIRSQYLEGLEKIKKLKEEYSQPNKE